MAFVCLFPRQRQYSGLHCFDAKLNTINTTLMPALSVSGKMILQNHYETGGWIY